jgi:Domain of Unknown Function (DUF1080)
MYRSFIWVFVASIFVVNSAAAKDAKELFNGKDLTGWEGDARVWSVENGAIVGHTKDVPLKHNTFLIWKDGKVGDFKLTLEFKLEGGNSGIQYRSKVIDPKEYIVGGYQADMDGVNQYTGIMYEERGRGILAQRGETLTIDGDGKKEATKIGDAAELAKTIHKDDWNTYEIEAIDRDSEKAVKSGILALQVHAGLPAPMTVSFRKIRLEELDAKKTKKEKGTKKKVKAV